MLNRFGAEAVTSDSDATSSDSSETDAEDEVWYPQILLLWTNFDILTTNAGNPYNQKINIPIQFFHTLLRDTGWETPASYNFYIIWFFLMSLIWSPLRGRGGVLIITWVMWNYHSWLDYHPARCALDSYIYKTGANLLGVVA